MENVLIIFNMLSASEMIDTDGFRFNVGIVLIDSMQRVFWGKRVGLDAWQFPQGGILADETPEQAMYRELDEEIGLQTQDVEILGCTTDWLYYRLPRNFIRYHKKPLCIGQKQKWFLVQLTTSDTKVKLDKHAIPEFECWRWVDYWHPLAEIIDFKREVYDKALEELAPLVGLSKVLEIHQTKSQKEDQC
jgi:putative (di)nucleoside polyphosphate hydrolase